MRRDYVQPKKTLSQCHPAMSRESSGKWKVVLRYIYVSMATSYVCGSCRTFGADESISSGRNLVVCIDGTSQQFGEKNTNIIELYNQMLKDSTQLTYYNSGIGTYAKPSKKTLGHWRRVMDSNIDLGIAWNFDRIVKAAYRWLSQHYQEGDRIYLFGFSRGAYQVRTLAAMIHTVGLIHKGNEEQIPFAYSLYEHSSHGDSKTNTKILERIKSQRPPPAYSVPNQEAHEREMPTVSDHALEKSLYTEQTPVSENSVARGAEQCDELPKTGQTSVISQRAASSAKGVNRRSLPERFKDAFSRKVRVHFVGVWDTVSSIGLIRGKNLPATDDPHTTCCLRHALALDEYRVKFLPEYASGGIMLNGKDRRTAAGVDVKEVWFNGSHSDVGGLIDEEQTPVIVHPSLPWMRSEAVLKGLKFDPSKERTWETELKIHRSLKGMWKAAEIIPWKRLSYKDVDSMTWRLHLGQGRIVQDGQKLHISVIERERELKAQLPPVVKTIFNMTLDKRDRNLTTTRVAEAWPEYFEIDPTYLAQMSPIVQMLCKSLNDNVMYVHHLDMLKVSAHGIRALLDANHESAAKSLLLAIERKWEPPMQVAALDVVQKTIYNISDMQDPGPELHRVLRTLLKDDNPSHQLQVAAFVAHFKDTSHWCNDILKKHAIPVLSLTLHVPHAPDYVKLESLNILDKLLPIEEHRNELLKQNLLSDLSPLLKYEDWRACRKAITFIDHFGQYVNFHEKEDPVMNMLGHLRELNRKQLSGRDDLKFDDLHLVESQVDDHDERDRIVVSTVVNSLYNVLDHENPEVRQHGLQMIEVLSKHVIFRRKIIESDSAIPLKLQELLGASGEHERVLMQCKSTVTTLTKYHDVWHALHETRDLNVDLWMNAKHDTTQARLKFGGNR